MPTTNIDLRTAELAQVLNVTPRMVNLYRAAAEKSCGRKLGTKRGRATYFTPEEQELIRKAQILGATAETTRQQERPTDFTAADYEAEEEIVTGMEDIVLAGDRNAMQMGRELGTRWNNLMWSAALQQMQRGMVRMQQQFNEMHSSVAVALDADYLPELTGQPDAPQLPEADEG